MVDLLHLSISLRLIFFIAEFNGHDELIALIGRSSLRPTIKSRTVAVLPSGHTKRMRSVAVSLSNRDLFATRCFFLHYYCLFLFQKKKKLNKRDNLLYSLLDETQTHFDNGIIKKTKLAHLIYSLLMC